jgi:predicted nucleotidyltransferase
MGKPDPAEILRLLASHGVEFVVVGMAAGVLRGAPVTTVDLDIVHRREAQNVSRLLQALAELQATYRHDPRRLTPTESHLMTEGHQLLATRHGDLDCLGMVGEGQTYEDLLDRAPGLELLEGVVIRVIDLPTLIELKEQAGRPKDRAALPVLRATLAETRRRG